MVARIGAHVPSPFRRRGRAPRVWHRARASCRADSAGCRLRADRRYYQSRRAAFAAFCACELRSPAPLSEEGFREFNEAYVARLRKWGRIQAGGNPVARSNVCPAVDPPSEPSFHAFSFTTRATDAPHSFVVAGSGEAPEGQGNYRDHIVDRGDLADAAMRCKAAWELSEMERRMSLLAAGWPDTTAVQLHTIHNTHSFIIDEIVRRGAARSGLTWHFARPPVVDIEYEMDCRAVHIEQAVAAAR